MEFARPVRGYIAVRLPFATAMFHGHVGESDVRRDGNDASLRWYWAVMGESRGQRTLAVGGWEHGRFSAVESCDSGDRVNYAIRAMMVCGKSASSLMTS